MKLSRRQLFLASLGATQLALLARTGPGPLGMRQARAGGSTPTKLLTIWVPGGWVPCSIVAPLSQENMALGLPPATFEAGPKMSAFYTWDQAVNCDGSGHAEAGSTIQRMRIPRMWDEASLEKGMPDQGIAHPSSGFKTTSNGWSWMEYELWKRTCFLHGINQQTAAHDSALISSLCGAAGSEFRAPSMHAVIADALYDTYADTRPLPSVMVGAAPNTPNGSLPARVAPMRLSSASALQDTLSRKSDYQWEYFRDAAENPDSDFSGVAGGTRMTNAIDERALHRVQAMRGLGGKGTDAFYADLYDRYRGVSSTLARNIVDLVDATPAIDPSIPKPFWGNPGWTQWGVGEAGGTWDSDFQLTLKLLRSDIATSIGLRVPGPENFTFDTHGSPIAEHCIQLNACFEVIGRFLGVMGMTPAKNGGTLLDETLVVIFSEFGRTWPSGGDHWPYTSVAILGGNIEGNRQIGNYDVPKGAVGVPVKIMEEGSSAVERVPTSADVCSTIYNALGARDHFIPGGFGEIQGVLKT